MENLRLPENPQLATFRALVRRHHRFVAWGGFLTFASLPLFQLAARWSRDFLLLWLVPFVLWTSHNVILEYRIGCAKFGFWYVLQERSASNYIVPLAAGSVIGWGGALAIISAYSPGPPRPVPLSLVLIPLLFLFGVPLMAVVVRLRDKMFPRVYFRHERRTRTQIVTSIGEALAANHVDLRFEPKGRHLGLVLGSCPTFYVLGGSMTLYILGAQKHPKTLIIRRFATEASLVELRAVEQIIDASLESPAAQ